MRTSVAGPRERPQSRVLAQPPDTVGYYRRMRILESSESTPSAELEAKVHQHHRGLTAVMLRRRGRQPFKSLQLEGKDGSSVAHREAPKDTPEAIARAAWEALTEHASRNGAASYEVELLFASAEKGPPPKAVVVPLAVGEEYNELGGGTDPSVVVELAMRLAGFSMLSLRGLLNELPAIGAATAANMVELRKLGEQMLQAMSTAASGSDKLAMARLEAEQQKERLAFAREFVGPGLAAIREALGQSSIATLREAAKPNAPGVVVDERIAKLQAEVVETGRTFARGITDSLREQLAAVLGKPMGERLAKLRDATSHTDVLELAADVIDSGPKALPAFQLLSNEQISQLEAVRELSKQLREASKGPAT